MTDTSAPRVSVIVPVKDGLEGLVLCVTRLLEQDYPGDRMEILVVDNGSAVSPEPFLPADPRLRVLREDTPGSYAARNTALDVAKGDVLAFTDADCIPAPDWVSRSVEALLHEPRAAMVAGAVDVVFAGGGPRTPPEWYESLHAFPQEAYITERGFGVTANMVTWREQFEQVGAFDASLRSGGDAEWGRRVKAAGGRQRYAPLARVGHPARATWRELKTKHVRTTRGVCEKMQRRRDHRVRAVRYMLGQIFGALRLSVRVWSLPDPNTTSAKAKYLLAYWAVAFINFSVLLSSVVSRKPASTPVTNWAGGRDDTRS